MADRPRSGPDATDRLRLSAALLLGLVVFTLSAPALTTASPDTVEDPLASRHLAPGSSRWLIELRDGATLVAERVEWTAAGGLAARRLGVAVEVEPHELAGPPTARRYWLGTDHLGRDLAARLVHGWRNSLAIALGATLLAVVFGSGVGLGAALGARGWDRRLMRGVDLWRSLPKLFVLLCLAALHESGGLVLALTLAAVSWTSIARLSRAEARSLRGADFVESARAAGCSTQRIVVVHLLPHLRSTLVTLALLQLSNLILLEAALSFVGAGLAPGTPTLGGLVADAALRGSPTWWTVLFPGLAIASASLTCQLLAGAIDRRGLPALGFTGVWTAAASRSRAWSTLSLPSSRGPS